MIMLIIKIYIYTLEREMNRKQADRSKARIVAWVSDILKPFRYKTDEL